MKKYISIFSPVLFLLACGSAKRNEVRSFIPGTYVRFSSHEMRTEYDTIKIEPISAAGNNYHLVRSSYFQKKLDGQALPWEYKAEEWTAVYDDDLKVLNESKKGKVISFIPEEKTMLVGTTRYKKTK